MYSTKLTFIFCLLCFAGFAQKKKHAAPPPPPIVPPSRADYAVLEKRMACMYRNKYKSAERLNFFPFNQYKKVMLISFELPEPSADILITDNKSIPEKPIKETNTTALLAKNQRLDLTRIKEKKILSALEVDRLTEVLYNFGYTSTKSYKGLLIGEAGYSCYNPRNAIVFINNEGQIAEYIEICFECQRREESSEKIKTGEFCTEKYNLIRNFFYAAGIKYGTTKRTN